MPARLLPARPLLARPFLARSLMVAAAVSLSACGGWWDDEEGASAEAEAAAAAGESAPLAITCATDKFVAGAVAAPTAAQLATYTGTYEGKEGSYAMDGSFTQSGTATLVLSSSGAVSYKGVAYTPSSICIDKTAGPMGTLLYVMAGLGHFDIADKADAALGSAWGVAADSAQIFTAGFKK